MGVYTTDYLAVVLHTNFAPTSVRASLALYGVAPRLVLGQLRVLRVRLLSIVCYKKRSAAGGNTKRKPPRISAGSTCWYAVTQAGE